MRIENQPPRSASQGYALILTLLFVSVCVAVLGSMCKWAANEAALTARNNMYNTTVAAAESATEASIAQMNRDFLHQALSANVNTYNGATPATFVTTGWPADYQFCDAQGTANKSDIVCKGWQTWTNLNSEFAGLYGMVNTYQITSKAKRITGPHTVAAAVRQEVQFTAVPIFQFAIFYSMDLEINPSPPMLVTGKTHGNANIYLAPSTSLEFVDTVSAVGHIIFSRGPNDPTDPSGSNKVNPDFDGKHLEQVSSLNLPIGVGNNPSNVVGILDVPPDGEDPYSDMGRQRFYNRSDLIVTVTNNAVKVTYNNNEDGTSFTVVPTNSASGSGATGYSFVRTNVVFYDYRENKEVLATEIDVKAFTNWLATSGFSLNVQAQVQMGHSINSIYVNDQRSVSGKLTAARLANGQYLPASGLTVSTARPLYVKGHFNAPDLTVGSTNTVQTKPAALASDAITILSSSWNDGWNSGTGLSSRNAGNTTVNAAFLSGIVPTGVYGGQKRYSGGVENFPRFLENWSSSTMTYNGSMVVMFASRQATNFWVGPGTYYNAPTRKWAFDKNFLDATRLPPSTPQVRKLQRGQWSIVAVNGK